MRTSVLGIAHRRAIRSWISGTGVRPRWSRVKFRVNAVDRNGSGSTADEQGACYVVSLAEAVGLGGGKWRSFRSLAGLDEVFLEFSDSLGGRFGSFI